MYKNTWDKILNAKHIVIASHVHPDGDTLGSSIGLYHALKNLGKKVSLYNATKDELPNEFDFLDAYSKISDKLPRFFDLLISCDCGSFDRLGVKKDSFEIINIDHHASNELYGDINIVLKNATSAGMVVYELLKENKIDIPKNSAIALYTAIADDTGFFRYADINEKTFEAVLALIKCGVNPSFISKKVHGRKSLAKTRLNAYVLNNFDLHVDASIASIIISQEVLEKTGARRSDTKNIITQLSDIANVEVSIMVLEQKDFLKISLRSNKDKDVSKIAHIYKGGGHKHAAGFNIYDSDTKKICEELVQKVKNL